MTLAVPAPSSPSQLPGVQSIDLNKILTAPRSLYNFTGSDALLSIQHSILCPSRILLAQLGVTNKAGGLLSFLPLQNGQNDADQGVKTLTCIPLV